MPLSAAHDHQHCIQQALTRAEDHCRRSNQRLTPIRRRVLELVWQSHRPVGAYDILAILGAEGFSSAPPTVYRALDFLLDQHLIHRIARLNAFIGCTHPGTPHAGQFLLCRHCGLAVELDATPISDAISQAAHQAGFLLTSHMIEAEGLCPTCQNSETAHA